MAAEVWAQPLVRVRQAIDARLNAARSEAEQAKVEARQAAAELVRYAEKEAQALVGNTTFRNIYYVYDNIIHEIAPNAEVKPLIHPTYHAIDPAAVRRYEQELEDYRRAVSQEPERHGPRAGGRRRFNNFVSSAPSSRPRPPVPPRGKQLNAAVADIVVDVDLNRLYWARWAAPFQVCALHLETQDIEVLYERAKPVTSVALDPDEGRLYWLEGNETIMRGRMDKKMAEADDAELFLPITAPDKGGLWQLDIDTVHRRLYWTNDISIWRADLVDHPEETSLMVVSPSESPFPIDLAVDGDNSALYWIDADLKSLRKSDLEGRRITDLYAVETPTRGLKVDPVSNVLYWSDKVEGRHALLRGATQDRSIRLDGQREYIELQDIDPGDEFTVELWVNPQSIDKTQCFMSKAGEDSDLFRIGFEKEQDWRIKLHDRTLQTRGSKRTGLQHIALVVKKLGVSKKRRRLTLFHEGDQVTTTTRTVSDTGLAGRPWILGMERDGDKASGFLDGSVREARLWRGVRSQDQIRLNRDGVLSEASEGLLGHWRTDRLVGHLLPDLSGHNHYGVLRQDGEASCIAQPTLRFDGISKYVDVGPMNLELDAGLTVEAWVYYDTLAAWTRVIDFGNDSTQDNIILSNAGRRESLGFYVRIGQDLAAVEKRDAGLKTGVWMHLAATIDPNGVARLYKDGQLVAEKANFPLPVEMRRSFNYIGKSNYASDALLHGRVATVRIWTYARSQAQLETNMHRRFTQVQDGLVHNWHMNEGTGRLIFDHGATSQHGQVETEKQLAKAELDEIKKERALALETLGREEKTLTQLNQLSEALMDIEAQLEGLLHLISQSEDASKALSDQLASICQTLAELQSDRDSRLKLISKIETEISLHNIDILSIKIAISTLEPLSEIIKSNDDKIEKNKNKLIRIQNIIKNKERDVINHKKYLIDISHQEKDQQKLLTETEENLHPILVHLEDLERQRDELKQRQSQQAAEDQHQLETQTQEVADLKTNIESLDAKVSELERALDGSLAEIWMVDDVPINPAVEPFYEVEALFDVPGLDALALVHQVDYARARRKEAYANLQQVRETTLSDQARARREASAQVEAARTEKNERIQTTAQLEAEALAQSEAEKRAAIALKRQETLNAEQKVGAAELDNEARLRETHDSAGEIKRKARDQAASMTTKARQRRNRAEADYKKAKAERARF